MADMCFENSGVGVSGSGFGDFGGSSSRLQPRTKERLLPVVVMSLLLMATIRGFQDTDSGDLYDNA